MQLRMFQLWNVLSVLPAIHFLVSVSHVSFMQIIIEKKMQMVVISKEMYENNLYFLNYIWEIKIISEYVINIHRIIES